MLLRTSVLKGFFLVPHFTLFLLLALILSSVSLEVIACSEGHFPDIIQGNSYTLWLLLACLYFKFYLAIRCCSPITPYDVIPSSNRGVKL